MSYVNQENDKYYMYCDEVEVMELNYKPNLNDVIKNDASGLFYKVINVEDFNCICKEISSIY